MTQTLTQPITFDQFLAWYPEDTGQRYELHDGKIVKVPRPLGKHSEVGGFLALKLGIEIERQGFPYFIPKECVVKVRESGYEPDVIVLNRSALKADPRWEKESTITRGESVKLVIEIASSNWSDDYARKLEDYEALGIPEYWICDYLGLGGRRYIGSPKRPTVLVYRQAAGEYQLQQFRGAEPIQSGVFPDLQLSLDQILAAV